MVGVCVRTCEKDEIYLIGEMKDSLWNGRLTHQYGNEEAYNYICTDGELELGSRKKITKAEDVWFEKDLLSNLEDEGK